MPQHRRMNLDELENFSIALEKIKSPNTTEHDKGEAHSILKGLKEYWLEHECYEALADFAAMESLHEVKI